jgi:hypothetical protein
VLWAVGLGLSSALPASAELPMAAAPGRYTSAAECGRCHQELHRSWSNTFHAQAILNPTYQADLARLEAENRRDLQVTCVSCHSPTTLVTMDYSLTLPLSREGVTCDFCHTVRAVDLNSGGWAYTNDLNAPKAGPGLRGAMAAHQTRPSALLLQSEFCAGCHQWVNSRGIAVLDTYGEWKRSPYRGEQVTCQMCHMPELLKTTMMLRGEKVDRPSHQHMEMGGHSQTQLAIAARLSLEASREGGEVAVTVGVENFKSGHMLPTGTPSRSVILELALLDGSGRELARREYVYRRLLVDEGGRPVEEMAAVWQKAASVAKDTRIGPKERRIEKGSFTLPPETGPVLVRATLRYRLKVPTLSPPQMDFTMVQATRILEAGHPARTFPVGWAAALGLALLALLLLVLTRFRTRNR